MENAEGYSIPYLITLISLYTLKRSLIPIPFVTLLQNPLHGIRKNNCVGITGFSSQLLKMESFQEGN